MMFNLFRKVVRNRIDATTENQQADIHSLAGEPHSDVEVMETFGISACPPDSVNIGLAAFIGGNGDNGVILGWFDKIFRPRNLSPGETCVYDAFGSKLLFNKDKESHLICGSGQTVVLDKLGTATTTDKFGSVIKTMTDGSIRIIPASGNVYVDANLHVSGGLSATGAATCASLAASGDVTAGGISLHNHDHETSVGAPV